MTNRKNLQSDRQTDRQTDRETDRQTDMKKGIRNKRITCPNYSQNLFISFSFVLNVHLTTPPPHAPPPPKNLFFALKTNSFILCLCSL